MRRRMGAAALEMDASDGSGRTRWRDIVAARLPSHHWPRQRVLITAVGGRSRSPREWGMDLATQVAELRAGGSKVETVFPDAGAGDVFNANALDPSTRRPAARGGCDQGRSLATRLSAFWLGA